MLAPCIIKVAPAFQFFYPPQQRIGLVQEDIMAKGQKRSNREIRKPKQKKESVTAPAVSIKGISDSIQIPKKKN